MAVRLSARDQSLNSNIATVRIDIGAQAIQVTKTADTDGPCLPNDCGLREAINFAGDGFTIEIPPGTYTLSPGRELNINRDVTLSGAGAQQTIIQATASGFNGTFGFFPGGPSRVIGIFGGNDITIIGVTIQGGVSDEGGGIFSAIGGTVTVVDSVVSGNQAQFGGGIKNNFGTFVLENTQVIGNTAFENGGGINNTGILIIDGSTIANNTANFGGGGIFDQNSLTLDFSVVRDNSATFGGGIRSFGSVEIFRSQITGNTVSFQGDGAGISVGGGSFFSVGSGNVSGFPFGGPFVNIFKSTIDGNSGGGRGAGISMEDFTDVFIEDTTTTISNNSSQNFGGGIYNLRGLLEVVNSTISGNNAVSDGGGIRNEGQTFLTNVTITNNRSGGFGGSGIDNPGGALTMANTIVADNPDGPDCSGGLQSEGFNLDSDFSCGLNTALGDLRGVNNPLLGPLADNGGPTRTHALQLQSPAVDVIPPFLAPRQTSAV